MVKSLEKDAAGVLLPFKTKNHAYEVIRPGDPMGIERWCSYHDLSIVAGYGKTFGDIADILENLERSLGADRNFADIRVESILTVNGLRRGIIEMSKMKYNYSLYLASVFVVRVGDDPLKWDINTANKYIADWAEEGLNEQDFFSFALSTVVRFREHYTKLKKEAEEQAEKLSAIGSFLRTDKGKSTAKN